MRWECLVGVQAVNRRRGRVGVDTDVPSFLCRDAQGGWATLVPRLAGWPEVAAAIAAELHAAHARGVPIPDRLLDELAEPTDVRIGTLGRRLSLRPFP